MTDRSAVLASPAFESIACGAQFRDRIAVVVKASPKAIFQALHDVALPEEARMGAVRDPVLAVQTDPLVSTDRLLRANQDAA